MPSLAQVSQNGLEQHFGAILKRTPHNLGTPHTAPRRVHIDVLPDVRAGSDPPFVDEAAEEGRRYRSQCRTAYRAPTSVCLQGLCGNLLHENTYFQRFECACGFIVRIRIHMHTRIFGRMC
jgi:hypothetical protein